jgi:hypothetical protein
MGHGIQGQQQAAEMRYLRSVIGTAIRDKIRNYDSGNKLCLENLNDTVKNTERDRKTTCNE